LKITIIITGILFLYAMFSTFFYQNNIVGDIGQAIGKINIHTFGYLAYINIPLLMYPLYSIYTHKYMGKTIDFYLGWILVFIGLLTLQALLFEDIENTGYIAHILVSFLEPFIGMAGLWFLWLMIVLLSLVLILEDDKISQNLKHLTETKAHFDGTWKETSKAFISDIFQALSTHPFSSPQQEDILMPKLKNIEFEEKPRYVTEPEVKEVPKKETEIIHKDKRIEVKEEAKEEAKEEIKERPIKKKEVVIAKKPSNRVHELEENSKLMKNIDKGKIAKPQNFILPKLDFLEKAPKTTIKIDEAEIDNKIEELLSKLRQFRIEGDVVRTYSGPLVTTFEFKPAPNVKVSKILGLQDDLAMALSAETIRIQAPIRGRDVVGIEIPNKAIETIYLRDILESEVFKNSSSSLTVALGKDIVGNAFVTDIKKLPHLLIAGTTGSGKSVGINAMILSLLYRNDPDQLKLMLIDPKMLEFSMYNDIPHLITPVITEPNKAIAALANMVGEMERRYKLMAESRTKNIENYNEKVTKEQSAEAFPFIVIVIDELADLMMNGGKEVELSIARLAQKSRACGIHLIVATQRPSVDVVTGLIKANLPSRLSYRVGSRIDSKVILDALGADSLLGRGDGLFTPPGTTGLIRIHAPWNTEIEIDKIVEFLKAQRLPEYDESYLIAENSNTMQSNKNMDTVLDSLYEEAKAVVINDQKTSISYLQRKLQIGYNRSANIIEQLENQGVLSIANSKGNREIL
jgi:S-DNA-T family DNA segregation ATPase FtsK/SpoIIIE